METIDAAGAPATREQAQQRADQVRAFRAEFDRLQAEGVLAVSSEQAAAIRRHHDGVLEDLAKRFDVDRTAAERQMSLGMRVASLLGAIALSAAVFLFFYRFWGLLSVPLQVVLLASAPIVAAAAVEVAARREKTLYIASLLALVAFASFVLGLSVVGSIFNMPPSFGAFLAWALFALLLAYAYRLRLLLFIGILCAGTWLGALLTSLTGAWWGNLMLRPENFVIAGALSLAMARLSTRLGDREFAYVYRATGCAALLLPMLWLSEIGEISYLPIDPSFIRHGYDVAGFALGMATVWFAIRRGWTETVNGGGLFLALFLCLKLYDWCWDWMPRYLFFLTIGVVAIALIAVLQRLRGRRSAAGARRTA
ncbi:MAG: DUF2157 domain-containing protein [Bacteroidales bacterium]